MLTLSIDCRSRHERYAAPIRSTPTASAPSAASHVAAAAATESTEADAPAATDALRQQDPEGATDNHHNTRSFCLLLDTMARPFSHHRFRVQRPGCTVPRTTDPLRHILLVVLFK
jgi:hypothetical protein